MSDPPSHEPVSMHRRVVAPIQLGCCRTEPRCRLCAPSPPLPDASWVSAWVDFRCSPDDAGESTRARRGPPIAHFFGGPPPSSELLAAVAPDVEVAVTVRPDLLGRDEAVRLQRAGVRTLELDALTFDDHALRGVGRRYTGERVLQMAAGLRELGFEVGVTLALGLPATTHATSVADAERVVGRFDTARLHPVLVLLGSGLWSAHLDGFYDPLSLGQAITTCRAMLDVLEPAGVRVIRVGRQAGPDELGRAVAGPRHSSLRELVEARRTLDRLRALLSAEDRAGSEVVIRCAVADETRTRGPMNDNVRTLRAEFALAELLVRADPSLERGDFVLEAS